MVNWYEEKSEQDGYQEFIKGAIDMLDNKMSDTEDVLDMIDDEILELKDDIKFIKKEIKGLNKKDVPKNSIIDYISQKNKQISENEKEIKKEKKARKKVEGNLTIYNNISVTLQKVVKY